MAAHTHSLHATTTQGSAPESDALDLSCLLDDELDGPERERVLDRLMHDADAQRLWSTMHVVGDAIRSSEVACTHSAHFRARLAATLAQEMPIVAPRVALQRRRLMRRVVLPGAAVAAAAAMLMVVAVPQLRGGGDGAAPTATASKQAGGETRPVAAVAAPASRPMSPYLQAHREFAPVGVLAPSAPYLRTSATLPAEGAR